jgi:hypothetical protein
MAAREREKTTVGGLGGRCRLQAPRWRVPSITQADICKREEKYSNPFVIRLFFFPSRFIFNVVNPDDSRTCSIHFYNFPFCFFFLLLFYKNNWRGEKAIEDFRRREREKDKKWVEHEERSLKERQQSIVIFNWTPNSITKPFWESEGCFFFFFI